VSGAIRFKSCAGAEPLRLPCGRCTGCRLERSRQWAVRCVHEASQWENNVFVTLTYDDEHLPEDQGLDVSEFQRFAKRLRKARPDDKVRYFHCGEYGEREKRPHYHALLFNVDFKDKYAWRSDTFRSAELERLWPLGHSEFGGVTFESAAYVARYSLKKLTGQAAIEGYKRFHLRTGEEVSVAPEYATMSHGVGGSWLEQYAEEVYPLDRVFSRGREAKPPRYYDKRLAQVDPVLAAELRIERAREFDFENATEERLRVREVCAEKRLNLFKGRSL